MRRTGFLGVLFLGLTALVAGIVGYQIGLTSQAAASGATVVVTGGFPGLGILFFLLFFGALFFIMAGRSRRMGRPEAWAHGRGPWGGPWGSPTNGRSETDPRRAWIAEVHQRLHEEAAGADPNERGAD